MIYIITINHSLTGNIPIEIHELIQFPLIRRILDPTFKRNI